MCYGTSTERQIYAASSRPQHGRRAWSCAPLSQQIHACAQGKDAWIRSPKGNSKKRRTREIKHERRGKTKDQKTKSYQIFQGGWMAKIYFEKAVHLSGEISETTPEKMRSWRIMDTIHEQSIRTCLPLPPPLLSSCATVVRFFCALQVTHRGLLVTKHQHHDMATVRFGISSAGGGCAVPVGCRSVCAVGIPCAVPVSRSPGDALSEI